MFQEQFVPFESATRLLKIIRNKTDLPFIYMNLTYLYFIL